MLPKRLFALLPLSFALVLAPDYARAADNGELTALDACYAEAQWPVTASSAYVYGNARQREQLSNGFNRDVYAMRRLCYRMTLGGAAASGVAGQCADLLADMLKRHGAEAIAHASRQKGLCETLSGEGVTIDGL